MTALESLCFSVGRSEPLDLNKSSCIVGRPGVVAPGGVVVVVFFWYCGW